MPSICLGLGGICWSRASVVLSWYLHHHQRRIGMLVATAIVFETGRVAGSDPTAVGVVEYQTIW